MNVERRNPLRLAIVGCGAAARQCHLPGLAALDRIELVLLIDPIRDNAVALADAYSTLSGRDRPVRVATELGSILEGVDVALVASPHRTHAELTIELLRAKIHCLVEKPMALSTAECTAMARTSRQTGALLGVAHVRRLFPASQWVKKLLQTGALGEPKSIRWREGAPYDWPLASPSLFLRDVSGGGVLADSGPHVLDLLLWWLDADDAEVVACLDSSLGGAESESRLDLRIGRVAVDVIMSRLRKLENTCAIEGSEGSVEFGIDTESPYVLRDANGAEVERGMAPTLPPAVDGWEPLFSEQFRNFAAAVCGEEPVYATSADGARTVAVIEKCYAARQTLATPWRDWEAQ